MTSPFDYVSYDLLTHFFENYLNAASIVTCKLTCRHFRKILTRIAPKVCCTDVIQALAYTGMPLVEWFHKKLAYLSSTFLTPCAKSGALETLQWAYHKESELLRHMLLWDICEVAISSDRVNIIDWMFSSNLTGLIKNTGTASEMELLNQISEEAAYMGSIGVLDWCLKHGLKFRPSIYGRARHPACIKWIYNTTKLALPKFLLRMAGVEGDLKFMQWLYEHWCPLSVNTAAKVAAKGQLEALQWLHKRGCPWNEETSWNAFINGHTQVALWALENGCPKYGALDDLMRKSVTSNTENTSGSDSEDESNNGSESESLSGIYSESDNSIESD